MKKLLAIALMCFALPAQGQTLLDSLQSSTAALSQEIDLVVDDYQARGQTITALQDELAGIEAVHQEEIDALQSRITNLETQNAQMTAEIATMKSVIREVVESQGRKTGLLRQLIE